MIKKNCLYEREKDRVRVVTLSDQPAGGPPKGFYGRSQHEWATVRYIESGRKGYIRYDSLLSADYRFIGHVDPNLIWKASPLLRNPLVSDNDLTAAAEHDLRERAIAKHRKSILEGHFYSHMPVSQNATSALEQAIHMILAGV